MKTSPASSGSYDEKTEALRSMRALLTRFRSLLDEGLRPYGVTKAEVQVLHQVRLLEACTGAKLARTLNVSPQTVQALLVRSERSGWLQRGRDAENGRLVLWSLTKSGERMLQRAQGTFDELQARLWTGFRRTSLRELNLLLSQCLENLEELPSD